MKKLVLSSIGFGGIAVLVRALPLPWQPPIYGLDFAGFAFVLMHPRWSDEAVPGLRESLGRRVIRASAAGLVMWIGTGLAAYW